MPTPHRPASTVLVAIACIVLLASLAPAASSEGGHLVVVKLTDGGLLVERMEVPAGHTVNLVSSAETGLVDVILPPSAGRSASLVRLAESRTLVIECAGGELRLSTEGPDGRMVEYPARALDDLARYDIRVNVTGGGHRKAFLVSGYEQARPDDGPVANMFAGRLPFALGEQDFVVL